MSANSLLLFTNGFPYGEGEQFLETEIRYLSKSFKEVHIFPLTAEGEMRQVPENVKIKLLNPYAYYSPKKLLAKQFFKLVNLYYSILRVSPGKERKLYIRRFPFFFLQMLHKVNGAKIISTEFEKYNLEDCVIYTYWFNLWTMLLCFNKLFSKQNYFITTRAHGGDFDLAQNSQGYFLFRNFEMKQVNRILTVSDYGKNYFNKVLPGKHEIYTSRLGVCDHGSNPLNTSKKLYLASCCFIVPLKRMHLVLEILKELKMEVEWTHFGGGELYEDIKKRAKELPENIKAVFKGSVPNKEIIEFYKNNPVDIFMNVSELEGIPVSIMEAISFGIPSIGCDTCGVPEIVTEESGFLLPVKFKTTQAVNYLEAYYNKPADEKLKFRKGVKHFWDMHFNADKNYQEFIHRYLEKSYVRN